MFRFFKDKDALLPEICDELNSEAKLHNYVYFQQSYKAKLVTYAHVMRLCLF